MAATRERLLSSLVPPAQLSPSCAPTPALDFCCVTFPCFLPFAFFDWLVSRNSRSVKRFFPTGHRAWFKICDILVDLLPLFQSDSYRGNSQTLKSFFWLLSICISKSSFFPGFPKRPNPPDDLVFDILPCPSDCREMGNYGIDALMNPHRMLTLSPMPLHVITLVLGHSPY